VYRAVELLLRHRADPNLIATMYGTTCAALRQDVFRGARVDGSFWLDHRVICRRKLKRLEDYSEESQDEDFINMILARDVNAYYGMH
jgi:hypothetical protein